MLPSQCLESNTRSDHPKAVVATRYGSKMIFLGFSGSASVEPTDTLLNSVVLEPSEDSSREKPDLLALTIVRTLEMAKGQLRTETGSFIIPVYWIEEDGNRKIAIELDTIYTPQMLIQAYYDHVHVTRGEFVFTAKVVPPAGASEENQRGCTIH